MRIAHNPHTGEYLGLYGGEWKPLRVAENSRGEKVYLGENGWERMPGQAETPDAQSRQGGAWNDIARGLGIGTRNVLEGLGEIPDMLNQPINAIGGLMGYNPNLQNPGEAFADWMGLPKAESASEKMLSAFERGVAGAVPGIGAGMAPAVAKALPTVAKALRAEPAMQLASSGLAEVGAEGARQGGAGTGGQIAAGILSGMAPAGLAAAGSTAARSLSSGARALEALSDAGQRRIAAENIRNMASDKDAMMKELENIREYVPGSAPTLGQVAGDPGIAVAEKGRASRGTDGALYGQRYRDQAEARSNAINDLYAGIEERLAGQKGGVDAAVSGMENGYFPYGASDAYAGGKLKDIYKEQYDLQKGITRDSYNAIDPEGSTLFRLEPLRESFNEILPSGPLAAPVPGEIQRFIGQMDRAIAEGVPVSYRDLQNTRTTLQDITQKAQNAGDAQTLRIAAGMKQRLDDYLLNAANEVGGVGEISPKSKTYRDSKKIAREMAQDDPWYNALGTMRKMGINRDFIATEYGEEAVRNLNKLYPGLVRKEGTFVPGTMNDAMDMPWMKENGLSSADAVYEMLLDRLPDRKNLKQRTEGYLSDMFDQYEAAAGEKKYGFTPEQADNFLLAKGLRKFQADRFEKGYNKKLSLGNADTGIREGEVMQHYFQRGPKGFDAAQDFMKAFAASPEAKDIMSDYIVSRFRAASAEKGTMKASKMKKFLTDYGSFINAFPEVKSGLEGIAERQGRIEAAEAVKKGLFSAGRNGKAKFTGKGLSAADMEALDPVEVSRIRDIQADEARNRLMNELSAVRGSPTAQNLATQAIMDSFLGKSLGRNKGGGIGTGWKQIGRNMLAGAANRTAEMLYGTADKKINELIDRAFLDPAFARELLTQQKPYTAKVRYGDMLKSRMNPAAMQTMRGILGLFEQE